MIQNQRKELKRHKALNFLAGMASVNLFPKTKYEEAIKRSQALTDRRQHLEGISPELALQRIYAEKHKGMLMIAFIQFALMGLLLFLIYFELNSSFIFTTLIVFFVAQVAPVILFHLLPDSSLKG